jgi:hypothetical protein
LKANQRAEASKLEEIRGQELYQLTYILGRIQQEHQSIISSCGGAHRAPPTGSSMVNGIPVEDAVVQLQLDLQIVKSRLRSDATSVYGHTFESYEDTLKLVVVHCSADDCQYVMDIPALYSLVRTDGPEE